MRAYKSRDTHTCVFKEALTSREIKQLILLKVSAQFILLERNYAFWRMSSLVQCYFFNEKYFFKTKETERIITNVEK